MVDRQLGADELAPAGETIEGLEGELLVALKVKDSALARQIMERLGQLQLMLETDGLSDPQPSA